MEQQNVLVSFLPLIILTVPIIILNISIASRKGKSPFLFGIVSLLPLVGFYVAIYLSSLTDKSLSEKIDKIMKISE